MNKPRALRTAALATACALLAGAIAIERRRPYTVAAAPDIGLSQPSEHARWPWPDAARTSPHRGVTHWLTTSRDGTSCELLQFDLEANPNLRLGLYAQDQDDAQPMDNNVRFWARGVGQVTRDLNRQAASSVQSAKQGVIVAACNGPFFGYRHVSQQVQSEIGFHVAPIVLGGKAYHNTGNHRWTFGAKYLGGRPHFKTFHLPGRAQMERELDWASGSVQCLIKDGRALKLEPFPSGPRDFKKQPVASTAQEAGHIPYFDHAKFSRVSLAWKSRADGSVARFFWLVVREPNGASEGQSIDDLARWKPQTRGWNVPDVQNFWLSMLRAGLIDNAINSDAGDCAQMVYRLQDGRYQMVSPIGDNPSFERRVFGPDFKGAPAGGTVMNFTVRDVAEVAQ